MYIQLKCDKCAQHHVRLEFESLPISVLVAFPTIFLISQARLDMYNMEIQAGRRVGIGGACVLHGHGIGSHTDTQAAVDYAATRIRRLLRLFFRH